MWSVSSPATFRCGYARVISASPTGPMIGQTIGLPPEFVRYSANSLPSILMVTLSSLFSAVTSATTGKPLDTPNANATKPHTAATRRKNIDTSGGGKAEQIGRGHEPGDGSCAHYATRQRGRLPLFCGCRSNADRANGEYVDGHIQPVEMGGSSPNIRPSVRLYHVVATRLFVRRFNRPQVFAQPDKY